jgi:hypothetical protein
MGRKEATGQCARAEWREGRGNKGTGDDERRRAVQRVRVDEGARLALAGSRVGESGRAAVGLGNASRLLVRASDGDVRPVVERSVRNRVGGGVEEELLALVVDAAGESVGEGGARVGVSGAGRAGLGGGVGEVVAGAGGRGDATEEDR